MPNQPQQGNPMNALGESVSFGRFMSESLSWEKWSTFSQNRYVEEAERYARPGSVAQKKAFFEAHYKRIAAQKAAALLEQENNAAKNTTEPEYGTVLVDKNPANSETTVLNSHEAAVEQAESEVKTEDPELDFLVKNDSEKTSEVKSDEQVAAGEVVESHMAVEQEAVPAETLAKTTVNKGDVVENQDTTSGSELSGTSQIEKPLLMKGNSSDLQEVSSVKSKKKSAFASLKSSVYRKTSKLPFSPAKPIASQQVKKDKNPTPLTKKSTPTPLAKKPTAVDLTEKKRSTPKSLQKYLTSTPAKEPDKVIATATTRKKENSLKAAAAAAISYKSSQDCATPLRTPNMAPSAKVSQHAPGTPCRESTRPKSPNYGSKSTGPKWNILSSVCSKSLTACRSKLQSPTLSTPFILRTEERAARRKQKLEEKFNSKEVQKVQLQTKLKEKAESELRKLRQSFCFKARPLPDFYKEREPTKIQTKKSSAIHHNSAKTGRKPSSSTTSVPPSISKNKCTNNNSKNVSTKNGQKAQNTPSFFPSVPETINHENKSPNILY